MNYRNTDPETSKDAGQRATFAPGQQQRIQACLKEYQPMGAEQIGGILDMPAYAVRKRLSELESLGVIRQTGETRKTVSGRFERIWEAL